MIRCSPGNRFRLCWRFVSHSEGPRESTDTGSKMGTGIKRTIRRLCIEMPRPTLTVDVILINALFLPHHTLNRLSYTPQACSHTRSIIICTYRSVQRGSADFSPPPTERRPTWYHSQTYTTTSVFHPLWDRTQATFSHDLDPSSALIRGQSHAPVWTGLAPKLTHMCSKRLQRNTATTSNPLLEYSKHGGGCNEPLCSHLYIYVQLKAENV